MGLLLVEAAGLRVPAERGRPLGQALRVLGGASAYAPGTSCSSRPLASTSPSRQALAVSGDLRLVLGGLPQLLEAGLRTSEDL